MDYNKNRDLSFRNMQPIPIIALCATIASAIVFSLLYRLYSKERFSPALKNFRRGLLCAGLIAATYSLPGLFVKNVYIIDFIYLLNQIFFLLLFFFLLRFVKDLLKPQKPPLAINILETGIIVCVLFYFLYTIVRIVFKIQLPPSPVIIANKFIIYKTTGRNLAYFAVGIVTTLTALASVITVFSRRVFIADKRLAKKSLFIGFGFMSLVCWTTCGWLLAPLPGLAFLSIASVIFAIIGLILISIAVFVIKSK